MRTLATVAFSFSAAVFASVLLPACPWQLWAAAVFALCGVILLFLRHWKCRTRGLLVAFSLCAGFLFFVGYRAVFVAPIEEQCGQERSFSAVVCDLPEESEYGARVAVRLKDCHHARAVYYGDESLLSLVPGNELSGTAYWNTVDYDTFTAKGVHVLLYDRDDLTVEAGNPNGIHWWPQKVARAFREHISRVWGKENMRAFMAAELIGDKDGMVQEDYTALQETGLAHLFAVSGLHCAFLASLVQLCVPNHRRRLGCMVTIGVLLFYMCMTGLTPSVVRACIMQIFLLTAPLFLRRSDGLTALGAALLVILLANPYAAASVSLQLSFAATFGLAVLSPRIFKWLKGLYRGSDRILQKAVGFVGANLASSVGVMVFTIPLTAYYFNILSVVSPLTGMLTIWAAGWSFMGGFVATLLSFVWLPLGKVPGIVAAVLVQYILGIARFFARQPYHAVYFSNDYLKYWLIYAYAVFGTCFAFRKEKPRKYAVATLLTVAALVLTILCNSAVYRRGKLGVTALDVGQGQSVLLYAGNRAAMVDCGSSTGYIHAGDAAADELSAMGYTHLDALVVTHYHADHTNGLGEFLTRIPVDTVYLPDTEDEYGVREKLYDMAMEYGSDVVWVHQRTEVALGDATLTMFPPMDGDDLNEQCITALGTAGDFDVLITGDMPSNMEEQLIRQYALPDIEVLVVGHHGSKHSSCEEFLQAVTPDVAIISVGENHYGHPAQETLWRLDDVGAEIYRTDMSGHITVQSDGGEE